MFRVYYKSLYQDIRKGNIIEKEYFFLFLSKLIDVLDRLKKKNKKLIIIKQGVCKSTSRRLINWAPLSEERIALHP